MTNQIPFEVSDYNSGLLEAKGVLKILDEALMVEYKAQDAFVGLYKTELKTVNIPFSEIAKVEYKRNWFVSRIQIQLSSLRYTESLPGADGAELKFGIKRKYKKNAQAFVSKLALVLSEYRIQHLEDDF